MNPEIPMRLPVLLWPAIGAVEPVRSRATIYIVDPLSLALPLAAIDLDLENHAPIPLILDDLFMTFDDQRTKALLPFLTDLSRRPQVLIFTYHSHLKALVEPKVTVHNLMM
jgi:uncharacterized protein YhaN